MENNTLISIVIPSYNGCKTIQATIEAAALQVEKLPRGLVEIAVTDDCSVDITVAIVTEISARYDFVKLFINDTNLGMDGNFKQGALNARGKYVWYSGQDDILLEGAVAKALDVIYRNPDVGFIYFNFSQFDEVKDRIVCESVFHLQAHDSKMIDLETDLVLNGSGEYFAFFDDAPSFLPAIVMKRSYWETTNTDEFKRTYYIQYANIVLNLNKAKVVAITKPYVRGLLPASGWQTNGNRLFSILLGHFLAQTILSRMGSEIMPQSIYDAKKKSFVKRFFYICLAARAHGYLIKQENIDDLKFIFGESLFMTLYILPSIYIASNVPASFLNSVVKMRNLFFRR